MLQLLFRDYPQPLLSQSDVSMRGRSILAEEEAIARATRNIVIRLDPPWSNVTVVKRLAALKLYHDWDWRERPMCIAERCCSSQQDHSLFCRLQGLHWVLELLL